MNKRPDSCRFSVVPSGDAVRDSSHPRPVSAATGEDGLAYVADMVRELERLATKTGYETLGGILALAAREAEIQLSRAGGDQQT
jgi:glucose/arabinose dehydrogenase